VIVEGYAIDAHAMRRSTGRRPVANRALGDAFHLAHYRWPTKTDHRLALRPSSRPERLSHAGGYIHNAAFGDLPSLVNVPKTSVRGGEFDAIWKPVAQLTLSIAGTYVDSKVNSSFITSNPFGESVDISE